MVWLASCLLVTACGESTITGGAPAGRAPESAPPPAQVASGCTGPNALPEPRLVLGSIGHYINTLRDLLGSAAVSERDAATSGGLEFEIVDRAQMTTATLDQVLRLAEQAVESARGRTAQLLGCGAADDATCMQRGLASFARRAFKRPIDDAELASIIEVHASALEGTQPDAESAALRALQAILVAPSTLYRTEFLGTKSATSLELSAHERASALAALLLDSLPDADLEAAADDGSLMTEVGLQAQVDRLLAAPRVRKHVSALVLSAHRVPRVFETPKDGARFPEYTPELQSSMYEESQRFVDDVLWTRAAPTSELLTSRRTFVDASLAALYGVTPPAGDGFAPAELPPERAGLLTQASVMSVLSRTDKTSVVARGLFVRGPLLCLPKVPAPPASVQAQVTAQLGTQASEQELAEQRAVTSPCGGCHSQFDPLGLLLEGFDAIGKTRVQRPIAADLAMLSPLTGTVQSPAELAAAITKGGDFTRCLADRTLAYGLTQSVETTGDHCARDAFHRTLAAGGGNIAEVISAVVRDPMFLQRRLP